MMMVALLVEEKLVFWSIIIILLRSNTKWCCNQHYCQSYNTNKTHPPPVCFWFTRDKICCLLPPYILLITLQRTIWVTIMEDIVPMFANNQIFISWILVKIFALHPPVSSCEWRCVWWRRRWSPESELWSQCCHNHRRGLCLSFIKRRQSKKFV